MKLKLIISTILVLVIVGYGFFHFINNSSYREIIGTQQYSEFTFYDQIEMSDLVILGQIINVETRLVDRSTTDYVVSRNGTLNPTPIHKDLMLPYRFVTVDNIEYLKNSSNHESKTLTFADTTTSGEGIINGEKLKFSVIDKVTYTVGEEAIFFIENSDIGLVSDGYTSKYQIDDNGKISSMYGSETGKIKPLEVEDAKNIIRNATANQKIIDDFINKKAAQDELNIIHQEVVEKYPYVKFRTVQNVAKNILNEQLQSNPNNLFIDSLKIKSHFDEIFEKNKEFISDAEIITSSKT